jgi:hypothetical protein
MTPDTDTKQVVAAASSYAVRAAQTRPHAGYGLDCWSQAQEKKTSSTWLNAT